MKKFLYGALLPLVLISFVFFTGCPGTGPEAPTDKTADLINSVWAGETPRANDWLTISFRPDGKVIWSFSMDNTTNEWTYTFDSENKGTITNPAGGWNPAPNGFSISGNTLTVTNYGSHSGGSRNFKRVRQADLTVDPVPFTLGTLADNLANSVWAGETPRANDWLTISFKADGKVIWAFSADNTTNEWTYTYAAESGGTITNPGGGWNPAPTGFTMSGDTLTITNYGSHGGSARTFKRYR